MSEPERFQSSLISAQSHSTASPARLPLTVPVEHIAEIPKPSNSATSTPQSIEDSLQRAQQARQRFDADMQALDLTAVRCLLARQGWSLDAILCAELQFLSFLQSVRASPLTPQAPSAAADEYWHAFILITPLYIETCQQLFGRYLQHWPFAHGR